MYLKDSIIKLLSIRWIQHVAFWCFFISIIGLRMLEFEQEKAVIFVQYEAAVFSFTILIVYFNLRILIPRFWNRKDYLKYGLLLAFATLICVSAITIILISRPDYFKPPFGRLLNTEKIMAIHFARLFLFLCITSLIHFVKEWIKLKDDNLNLREKAQEQLEAELKILKGQVNPHFLFNTLNNIYSMSLYDSKKTPEMILKLSQLISYMLYECKDELVPLEKEIQFIENYIKLEAIRVEDVASVKFEVVGEDQGHRIPPLLFIPLVENAFKHGISNELEISDINIRMEICPGSVSLRIDNPGDNEDRSEDTPYRGLGIKNVRKRLELLFPNRHSLQINNANGIYTTQLSLEL